MTVYTWVVSQDTNTYLVVIAMLTVSIALNLVRYGSWVGKWQRAVDVAQHEVKELQDAVSDWKYRYSQVDKGVATEQAKVASLEARLADVKAEYAYVLKTLNIEKPLPILVPGVMPAHNPIRDNR